jgi:hypothetical protein
LTIRAGGSGRHNPQRSSQCPSARSDERLEPATSSRSRVSGFG